MRERLNKIVLAYAILLIVVINAAIISYGKNSAPDADFTSNKISGVIIEGERLALINRTVYLIRNGERRGFPSSEVFFSYGYAFDEIKPALAADLTVPEGPAMTFREGTLVKEPADPTVYIITGSEKRPFTSK